MKAKDVDENSLEFAKFHKKWLRFDVGDTVYLKSDIKKKCPMTISKFLIFDDDEDYGVVFTTSQKTVETIYVKDKVLCS